MGTSERAQNFYKHHLHDQLTERMSEMIQRQEMVFIATSDAQGNCDCSPRFGPPGFVHMVDSRTLAYPEFRGNGVYASLGNILENPHIGMVFVDFFDSTVGLHINGEAQSCSPEELPPQISSTLKLTPEEQSRVIERWVVINIEEAYIHCSKHIPQLQKVAKPIQWGTDDPKAKSSSFFNEYDLV